jgi:hypothetical protein
MGYCKSEDLGEEVNSVIKGMCDPLGPDKIEHLKALVRNFGRMEVALSDEDTLIVEHAGANDRNYAYSVHLKAPE